MYTGEMLFDLFAGQGVTVAEIAQYPSDELLARVSELREANPDEIPMSNVQIANAILDYAIESAGQK